MTKHVKLIAIGNSTGFVMPKELLDRLRVGRGDALHLIEDADGGVRLSPYDPEFERQMALGEDIMREDRDILRVLAK